MTLENRREGISGDRPSAARDLRFAGTIAAGCIAGVLGVGALTAPLLGWTSWPSAQSGPQGHGALTLAEPSVRLAPKHSAPSRKPSVLSPVTNTVPLPGQAGTVALRPGSLVSLVSSGGTATLPAGRSQSGAGTRGGTKTPGDNSTGGTPAPSRRGSATTAADPSAG
jgi:hypothetical protein